MAAVNISELFAACRDGDNTTVDRLLPSMSAADLNRPEPNGSSCLHAACDNGHSEIAQKLLSNGCSRRIQDQNGRTPADQPQTPEIAQLFTRPEAAEIERYVDGPSKQPQWLFGENVAEAFARAIVRGCVKDRGIPKTVKKLQAAYSKISNDQSEGNKLLQYHLNEAKETNDATFLLRAYTVECPFYTELNKFMATGALMKNRALDPYRFCGVVYRGMGLTENDLEQYEVGAALTNKALQSTSTLESRAREFAFNNLSEGKSPIIIRYTLCDRASALNMKSFSEYPEEEEVLMLPGCLFKVISVEKTITPMRACLQQIRMNNA